MDSEVKYDVTKYRQFEFDSGICATSFRFPLISENVDIFVGV